MALDVPTQNALSNDARFRFRVKNALANVAWQVLNEGTGVADHAVRYTYARNVIQSLDAIAGQIAQFIVGRTNIITANATVDLSTGAPVVLCDVTDAALQSQISTDWSKLAGVTGI